MSAREPDAVPKELRDLSEDNLPEASGRDKNQRFEHETHPKPVPEEDEDDDGTAGSP